MRRSRPTSDRFCRVIVTSQAPLLVKVEDLFRTVCRNLWLLAFCALVPLEDACSSLIGNSRASHAADVSKMRPPPAVRCNAPFAHPLLLARAMLSGMGKPQGGSLASRGSRPISDISLVNSNFVRIRAVLDWRFCRVTSRVWVAGRKKRTAEFADSGEGKSLSFTCG